MTPGGSADAPHLPQPALIDAYGDSGFRFAGMSHEVRSFAFPTASGFGRSATKQLNETHAAAVFDRAQTLDFFP
jgi:uncharacterized protein